MNLSNSLYTKLRKQAREMAHGIGVLAVRSEAWSLSQDLRWEAQDSLQLHGQAGDQAQNTQDRQGRDSLIDRAASLSEFRE